MNSLNSVLSWTPVSFTWDVIVAGSDKLITEVWKVKPKKEISMLPLWKLAAASGPYVKLAAINGAAAVILGAYGSHRKYPDDKRDLKQVFETASRYHFIHTLAMLGLPLCRTPFLAATFLMFGIVLFSGTCYYYAFTGDKQLSRLTPIGGICFIIGWLSMCI